MLPFQKACCCHMKWQPFLCNGHPRHGRCHCHHHRHLRHRCHCHRRCRRRCRHNCPLPLPLPLAIAVVVTINHCRRHLCCIAISHCVAVAFAVGHCRLNHCWPSQLPLPLTITVAMPLAISESCCLGMTRIVFNQLKQRMLTLLYIVHTVGSALIKAG